MTKDFRQNVFQGRSVLAEKDFTAAELEYLIDFGLHLKALKKKPVFLIIIWKVKTSPSYLKSHQPVPVQHLPLLLSILVPIQNTWVPEIFN